MINKANFSIIAKEIEILKLFSNDHIIKYITQHEIDNYI